MNINLCSGCSLVIRFKVSSENQPMPSSLPFKRSRVFIAITINRFFQLFSKCTKSGQKIITFIHSIEPENVNKDFEKEVCYKSDIAAFPQYSDKTILYFWY